MDQHEPDERHDPSEAGTLGDNTEARAGRRGAGITRDRAPGQRARGWAPIAVAATIAIAGVALGAVALSRGGHSTILLSSQSGTVKSGATITVTGSGSVTGTPDTLTFEIGVHSTGSTAAAALRENNALVARLESTLKARGVPSSGLQTSQLDIYANQNSKQKITGFSVDDDLSVITHKIASAGSVIDAAAGSAGNGVQLYGISFSISNQSSLLAKARAAAMVNARTEASQIAAGAGLTLGGIVRVTDEENSMQQPDYAYGEAAIPSALAGRVPVEVGSQPINVQVSVVYSLQG